jgi:hypothetical protein
MKVHVDGESLPASPARQSTHTYYPEISSPEPEMSAHLSVGGILVAAWIRFYPRKTMKQRISR